MTSESERRRRARARANLPVKRVPLSEGSEPDVSGVDASARIAMVWELTLDAWASSGRSIPDYSRAHAPGRLVRRDDPT
ncbi:MAG: hypothetical protein U0230_14175 [Polyangiales bacterium]